MENLIIQIFGLLFTAGGFTITYIVMRHKFRKEEREHAKLQTAEFLAHAEWKKNIEFAIEKTKLQTEEIKTQREKYLAEIWEAIEEIKEGHLDDMKSISEQHIIMMKELRQKNDELLKLVTGMNNMLIRLATQFEEHKKNSKEK